jgi:carbonic anhydrase
MRVLSHLFAQNQQWAAEMVRLDPEFFERLAHQQAPRYLWIGCSDSRVPANQIVGLLPGEMFVHRNVANVVVHTDLNCLSSIQFAVEVLKIEHVIVCGHYGCGGVLSALRDDKLGLIDNWLRHIQDVRSKHRPGLDALATEAERHHRLCELNVIEQVVNVSQTTVVRDAWSRGQSLAENIREEDAVELIMEPGDVSLHHTLIAHSSGPNLSGDWRIGIGISYIPTSVRHIGPTRLSATLARGTDRFNHFDHEAAPQAELDDAALAVRADSQSRYWAAASGITEMRHIH